MSLSARERAVLDATAFDVVSTAPVLAGLLAEGPEALRARGVPPRAINGLVPGWQRTRWLRRVFSRPRRG